MSAPFSLESYGIQATSIVRNANPAVLYELALENEKGTKIADNGALVAMSGAKTGRSPSDKRVVEEAESAPHVWWGPVNKPLPETSFDANRSRAIAFLNDRTQLYVVDGYAGWDQKYGIKVRVITTRAYHALFMHNMLIRPTPEQLSEFGEPDYVIFNAGECDADPAVAGLSSKTSVALHFGRREMVILGTQYAGEMKKGVFTILHYLMPHRDVLSMHCSANESSSGDVSIFFGLSGTGKTTLSADPARALIGDDEHCWTADGVFNIEGGCYAKAIDLSAEDEPEIFQAIRYGSVLENVGLDPATRGVDYSDRSLTENTRCSYPIEYIENAKVPCVGGHPRNVIFLTCDAFGVLPPVSKLSAAQAMYHFISGYTAKVAGTEMGVTEPTATFSACFGAPFLVWHPGKYAALLATKLQEHGAQTWLVNTGWTGGGYGVGARMSIKHTRAIIDGIHSGELARSPVVKDDLFGWDVPTICAGVPDDVLIPKKTWSDGAAYDAAAASLAGLFQQNFAQYADGVTPEVLAAAPKL